MESTPLEAGSTGADHGPTGLLVARSIGFAVAGAAAEFATPPAVIIGAGICGLAVLAVLAVRAPGR